MIYNEKPGEEEGSSEGNEAGGVSGHVRSVGSWEPTRAECGMPIGSPSAGIQRGNHPFLPTDPSELGWEPLGPELDAADHQGVVGIQDRRLHVRVLIEFAGDDRHDPSVSRGTR